MLTFLDKQPQNRFSFEPRSEKPKPPAKYKRPAIYTNLWARYDVRDSSFFISLWEEEILNFRESSVVNPWQVCLPSTRIPKDLLEAGLTSHLRAEAGQIVPLSAAWPLAYGVGCNCPGPGT